MKLTRITRQLGYILGAQWTRDISWTVFTILLARYNQDMMGQLATALAAGYLVKTASDVGLNDFLLSSFARRDGRPTVLLGQVTWLKSCFLLIALAVTWALALPLPPDQRLVMLFIAAGFGLDGVSDSFFALCQARGRQDVEMRIRIPSALLGIGYGIVCVLLQLPMLAIALYKPIESLCCAGLAVCALGHNPLHRLNWASLRDLAAKMRSGIIFTLMAGCTMCYNKINVFFLRQHSTAEVASYSVAWETVEGLSVLVSSALLGKVIFPLLARYWQENREAFRHLAGQTARSLWAAALPVIFLICVESDRFMPFVYGPDYADAATAQRLLTPCLATAFLHNLAAYAMIGMRKHKLLLKFYLSGLAVNIVCCQALIPELGLEGAALTLTITKVWVAILTVGYFQAVARPMSLWQWALMLLACGACLAAWYGVSLVARREIAELAGLVPLLLLFWRWRPPPPIEREPAAA